MDIHELLKTTAEHGGSDLHITTDHNPLMRVDGDLQPVSDTQPSRKEVETLIKKLVDKEQDYDAFDKGEEIDLSYEIADVGRFRVNVYQSDAGPAVAFRLLPHDIPDLESLGFGKLHKALCSKPHGLILVTGPTGSGKSTSLASMINYINQSQPKHIITIEDPIEYKYKNAKALIHQRENGKHTHGFNEALRAALRQDPDILLVGEMRDLETIRLALTAAETGHLVFATLHTRSAPQTASRIIDVFPGNEKQLVQTMLSNTLQAILGQVLLKREGGGRIAAQEIMLGTSAIRNLIRENKISQMHSAIQTGRDQGMQTLNQHKKRLAGEGYISWDYVED